MTLSLPLSTLFPYTTLFRSLRNDVKLTGHLMNSKQRLTRYGLSANASRSQVYYLAPAETRSEEHTSELQSRGHLVCRLLLEKKKNKNQIVKAMTQLVGTRRS